MSKSGRKFGHPDDYEMLRIHEGHLYWNGKKLKTMGWTRAEKLMLLGVLVAVFVTPTVITISNWDKIEPRLCSMHTFSFCGAPESDDAPSTSQEEKDKL